MRAMTSPREMAFSTTTVSASGTADTPLDRNCRRVRADDGRAQVRIAGTHCLDCFPRGEPAAFVVILRSKSRRHAAHQRPCALILSNGAIEAQRHEQIV